MDLSLAIAWSVPLAGVAASAVYGARDAAAQRTSIWGVALVMALLLGIGLPFVQVVLHGMCVETLRLCVGRGDVNMSYWFQFFFAIPVFWLVAGSAWQLKR